MNTLWTFQLAARDLLYAPYHKQDITHYSCKTQVGRRNRTSRSVTEVIPNFTLRNAGLTVNVCDKQICLKIYKCEQFIISEQELVTE